jgi:hypothetical protein
MKYRDREERQPNKTGNKRSLFMSNASQAVMPIDQSQAAVLDGR